MVRLDCALVGDDHLTAGCVEPHGAGGAWSTVNTVIPLRETVAKVYASYLEAHEVVKPDIWQERMVTLAKSAAGEPVIAIWDSGVDTDIFVPLGQMWTNTDEIPDNGIDDDDNGFIDDVHGIAYTLDNQKTAALLSGFESYSEPGNYSTERLISSTGMGPSPKLSILTALFP